MISLIFVALALIFEQTFGRRSVFHIKTLIRVDKSIRKEFSPNNTDLIQAKGFDETKLLKNIVLYWVVSISLSTFWESWCFFQIMATCQPTCLKILGFNTALVLMARKTPATVETPEAPPKKHISYSPDQPVTHPWKLTWNLKITQLKRIIIFQTSIFGFHVNLQGCKLYSFLLPIPFLQNGNSTRWRCYTCNHQTDHHQMPVDHPGAVRTSRML